MIRTCFPGPFRGRNRRLTTLGISAMIALSSWSVGLVNAQSAPVSSGLSSPSSVATFSNQPTVPSNPPPKQMLDPNTLVLNAVHYAVMGPPFTCKVEQRSVAYDRQVDLKGEYKSAGGGSGQFRYTARQWSGETTLDLIQVSDGRLMYTQFGKDPPRIVNVEKIRETLSPKLHKLQEHPEATLQLAIGGHAELLRSLYERFHWYAAAEGKDSGVDVWQLVGRIRTEVPRITGGARLDRENLAIQPHDNGLPMGVRLTLGRSSTSPYFPHKVEYFRLKKDKDGAAVDWVPVSQIKYVDPSTNVIIQDSDFAYRPDSSADKTEWETSLYLP